MLHSVICMGEFVQNRCIFGQVCAEYVYIFFESDGTKGEVNSVSSASVGSSGSAGVGAFPLLVSSAKRLAFCWYIRDVDRVSSASVGSSGSAGVGVFPLLVNSTKRFGFCWYVGGVDSGCRYYRRRHFPNVTIKVSEKTRFLLTHRRRR